jgi:hypothetical protein
LKQPGDWRGLDLTGDPILVVGRRPKPRVLEGFVVDLHAETFPTMRSIAETTLRPLPDLEALPWHSNADMVRGEQYLNIDVTDLPTPLTSVQAAVPDGALALADAADLIRLVLAPGQLDNLHPSELANEHWRFYAVVWESADAGKPIAFVSEYDPTFVLRKASAYFRFDGVLRNAPSPDFALDDSANLIVTEVEVAILNPPTFDRLFADIRHLLSDVPAYAKSLSTAMVGLPMSPGTEDVLARVCATKPSLARQLQNLSASKDATSITVASLRDALRKHGQAPGDFIVKGELTLDDDRARTFLDVAEGRWYEADFSGEPRRAARWSRRP